MEKMLKRQNFRSEPVQKEEVCIEIYYRIKFGKGCEI